jgi:type I restriction enzyme M protein
MPNIRHGNTLTQPATYIALFENAPKTFVVIPTKPPFGGNEGKDAQEQSAYAASSTQVQFVQNIQEELSLEGN